MKLIATLAASALFATTAQGCVRLFVNEIWSSSTERTREVTLWDQDKVSAVKIPFFYTQTDGDHYSGSGYHVLLNWNNDGGWVIYPNGGIGDITQQARRQTTMSDGRTQVYYCMWDNYDCGNYVCGLP